MSHQPLLAKWLAAALGAGLVALVAAFVPSPLRLFDLFFADAPKVEVREPPKLALKDMPSPEVYRSIVARPIFNPGRRPDPEVRSAGAEPAATAAGADLAGFRVVGIVADTQTQRAIVERQGAPALHVAPGDTVGGWRITKIDTNGITATKDGRSVRLSIPKTQPPSPTP